MELATGAILRRITQTPLSAAAHKLATIILDGIAWKDGYNGLERGTAAFTLGSLADKMGVSRQHLNLLLAELASSALELLRWKPHGKFAPWLFRFGAVDNLEPEPNHVSATDDTSLSRESKNKMMFVGKIEIGAASNVHRTPWGDLIKAAKTALPCWNVDTQVIWDAFRSFNQAKGNAEVPAGYLLGFMRKWRATKPNQATAGELRGVAGHNPTPQETLILDIIKAAPITNRHFHASDLRRAIGSAAYAARVLAISTQHGCSRFTATLVVHGQAVLESEITR